MLDKRTVMRVVDRGVATGELQNVCVHVPAHGEAQAEAIYVVLNKGIDLEGDPALVRRVRYLQQALQFLLFLLLFTIGLVNSLDCRTPQLLFKSIPFLCNFLQLAVFSKLWLVGFVFRLCASAHGVCPGAFGCCQHFLGHPHSVRLCRLLSEACEQPT